MGLHHELNGNAINNVGEGDGDGIGGGGGGGGVNEENSNTVILNGNAVIINGYNSKMNTNLELTSLKNFGLCEICGDRGSGYHYSVYSCEGCKGFFKRTVQKDLQYKCREYQQCVINKQTRNQCQFCRFQKCLMTGMKRDAVREDRILSRFLFNLNKPKHN